MCKWEVEIMRTYIYLISEIIFIWFWFWLANKINFSIYNWWSIPYILTGFLLGILIGIFVFAYFDEEE